LDNETQFPLQKPRESKSLVEVMQGAKPSNPDVDRAFQELAKLQSRKPENRSEEVSIQSKIYELKGFLAGQGIRPLDLTKSAESDESNRHKPRSTTPQQNGNGV
jgi:hypothetical protein